MARIQGWDGRHYAYSPSKLEQWVDDKSLELNFSAPGPGFNMMKDRIYMYKISGPKTASLSYERHPIGFFRRFPERTDLNRFGAYDYEALCSDEEFLETASYESGLARVCLRFDPGEVLLTMSEDGDDSRLNLMSQTIEAMTGFYEMDAKKRYVIAVADDFILKQRLKQGIIGYVPANM